MTSLIVAAVLQSAILATGVDATPISSESYTEASQAVEKTGKPLVVMVSTDWCPPCQTMKKKVMPQVREGGALRKVVFAMVNPDRDHDLAEKLIGGGPIPQLVMFRKKGDGWVRKALVGGQSVESVEQFIKEGVDADKKEHSTSDKAAAEGATNAPPAVKPTPDSRRAANDGDSAQHG
jgi:thioredoxin-like negative regulator of GroEL